MTEENGPLGEYRRRIAERNRAFEANGRRDGVIANVRLVVFLLAVVLGWLSFGVRWLHPAWVLAPVAVFIVLVVVHDGVLRAKKRALSAIRHYERGVARIEDRWAGVGPDGTGLASEEHPYARDLDILGSGSLFQLLCTAQTAAGRKTLADWLCSSATPEEIRARQAAVEELRTRLDLREELAFQGHDIETGVLPDVIVAWATSSPVLSSVRLRVLSFAIPTVTILAIYACSLQFQVGSMLLLPAIAAQAALYLKTRSRVRHVLNAAEEPSRELRIMGLALACVEQQTFQDPRLRAIHGRLADGASSASVCIGRLLRCLTMREASFNMLFAPIASLVAWDLHFAFAIEMWRRRYGGHIRQWIDAVGELEALCSLAAYAYEHPADPFPQIEEKGPIFDGAGLGHPFLSHEQCVRNDVVLNPQQRLYLVSGSNMSGKTVLLRTVGINTVLALAGAPVRARSLRLSPLAVGATLYIHDSIQTGTSRFYAEILRIRDLMNLARNGPPLLFLLDEVFHGTNSRDRKIGAQAVLDAFLGAGAIGLVTTHDLTLTEIVDELKGPAVNVHFEDQVEGDKLVFDYRLRPGVVQKSNALGLMRAIGLPV